MTTAILGGGIMGCTLAIALSEHGRKSTLFERETHLMAGASRWNEGKLHLGYLYAASGSLSTAQSILPGTISFRPWIENALGQPIDDWLTPQPDHYLLHRNSVIDQNTAQAYLDDIDVLVREHWPMTGLNRSSPPAGSERLTQADLAALANPADIEAGWRISEQSVDTQRLADALVERVISDPQIEVRCGTEVLDLRPDDRGRDGIHVVTGEHEAEYFDHVANALWSGRPSLDRKLLGTTDRISHHRYRVSAFIEGADANAQASAMVAFGPFGDIKNYGDGRFYASWYPAGLLVQGENVEPPEFERPGEARSTEILTQIRHALGQHLPGVDRVFASASRVRLQGGWVYAQGRGQLNQPGASIHKRDRWGILRNGNYISIDTGKYSTAPLLAERVADSLGD